MAEIRLNNLKKKFGKVTAVDRINLAIEDEEFLVIVGPSGCGKTTVLRMIAGLEEVSEGEIYIGNHIVNDLAPKNRDIAMVFQNYALYPHMDVYKNLSFGLRIRKFSKDDIDRQVREAARILGIEELLDRKPKELSGGQRQRVAMGRALIRKPQAFLFDEPLSNLDAKLRVQMRAELLRFHEQMQTTIVYVTHDQVEAMTLADRIVVMNKGVILQVATPFEVYNHPCNTFVAGFIGSPMMNFIDVTVVIENSGLFLQGQDFRLCMPRNLAERYQHLANKEAILGIRPEHIFTRQQKNLFPGCEALMVNVEVVELLGSAIILEASLASSHITAVVDAQTQIKPHEQTEFIIDMNQMHLFDKQTGEVYNP